MTRSQLPAVASSTSSTTTITPALSASALASTPIASASLATTTLTCASTAGAPRAVLTVFRSQIAWSMYLSGKLTAP